MVALIVDDNSVNIVMATAIMRKIGYTVFAAQNGPEALEILSNENIHLILMDYSMPEMDGAETITRIRNFESKNDKSPATIFAGSIDLSEKIKEELLSAGADMILEKPFSAENILAELARFFNLKSKK